MMTEFEDGFVGVHIGAGQHSEARTPTYLDICAKACQVGIDVLKRGDSALEAACAATMVLEDAGETNAGYGSNLTEVGHVEMDAGIMDGESLLFGAVGAMPGVRNPILVAKYLVQEQSKGLLPLGRVPPGFLVGEGARDWAARRGIPIVNEQNLISSKASKLYKHYKRKLTMFQESMGIKSQQLQPQQHQQQQQHHHHQYTSSGVKRQSTISEENLAKRHSLDDGVHDTVGVVVLDKQGRIASTVSSGGIALKQPGRVGQASCFGCGCWAQQGKNQSNTPYTVGISTTGCGEHLVRTFLARECALHLRKSAVPLTALEDVMQQKFAESDFLSAVPEKLGGAICVHYDRAQGRGEFLWTHTTASMGIAFQTTSQLTATTIMSRLKDSRPKPNGATTILVDALHFATRPVASHTSTAASAVKVTGSCSEASSPGGGDRPTSSAIESAKA